MYSRYNQQQPGQKLVINPAVISGSDSPVVVFNSANEVNASSTSTVKQAVRGGTTVLGQTDSSATYGESKAILCRLKSPISVKVGTILMLCVPTCSGSGTATITTSQFPGTLSLQWRARTVTTDWDPTTINWTGYGSLTFGGITFSGGNSSSDSLQRVTSTTTHTFGPHGVDSITDTARRETSTAYTVYGITIEPYITWTKDISDGAPTLSSISGVFTLNWATVTGSTTSDTSYYPGFILKK